MEHTVTGCNDCPLFENYEGSYICVHPSSTKETTYIPRKTEDEGGGMFSLAPDWCPLKKESLTITINK